MQWFGIIFLIWLVVFWRRKRTVNIYYSNSLSDQDKIECERIVLRTLKKYHDAQVGKLYPELVYQALNYKYDTGQITKAEYEAELKKITDRIII